MKTALTVRKYRNAKRPEYKYRVFLPCNTPNANRPYKVFKTLQDADEFARTHSPQDISTDILSASLPEQKRKEYVAAENILNEFEFNISVAEAVKEYAQFRNELETSYGMSLAKCIEFFKEYHFAKKRARDITVKTAIAEYLLILKTEGKSKEHIANVLQHLKRFTLHFPAINENTLCLNMGNILPNEFLEWLYSLTSLKDSTKKLSSKSLQNYFITFQAFFNWALKMEYIQRSPLDKISKPKIKDKKEPEIYTPEEIKILIRHAQKLKHKDILLFILIGAFAGLRHSEIKRLTWDKINLESKAITLNASITKTIQRRVVNIPDNLLAWLQPFQTNIQNPPTELICKPGFEERLKRFTKTLPIKWKRNALRHSCASYHLAKTQNEYETARQMGHSANVLKTNYMGLILSSKTIESYWNLSNPFPAY